MKNASDCRRLFRAASCALLCALFLGGCGGASSGSGQTAGEAAATVVREREEEASSFTEADLPEVNTGETAAPKEELLHIAGIEAYSLYVFDAAAGERVKTARFSAPWTAGTDIVSLESFAEDAERFPLSAGAGSAFMEAFRERWYALPGAEYCRIAYHVAFDLADGTQIRALIKKPGDELFYRPYLESYLYDDIHQEPDAWYSHLEPADADAETLLTSIKLTAGERVDEIVSDITLTGIVYDSADNFTPEGLYSGDRAFVTVIRRE